MIEGLIQGFSQELNLSAEDIADTLWLALQITSDSPDSPISQNELPPEPRKLPDSPSSPHEPTSSAPASQKQESPDFPSPREQLAERHIPEPKQEQKAEIYARNEQQSSKTAGLSIKVPDAYALREPLTLARALKPLMRRVASHQKRQILDEVATAQLIAEKNIWIPILKPTLEPWLDLDLVVDESISMQIWRATLKEVEKLLKNYGIFRNVRVWGLMTNDPENIQIRRGIGITAKSQSLRSPKELIDPSGRRLVLLATDCVSSVWRNGTLPPILKIWAKHGSMAIVQMLPKWMWKRTGLAQATEVRLRGLHPGDFNQTLMMESLAFWDELDEEQGVKVPVFSLEPERVLTWAQVLAGKGSVSVAGYFFDLDDIAFASESPSLDIGGDSSAKRRVQEFRVTASPMARKLAGLLASAPVITLPIVRLIQETLLPDSRQFNVAEVFLGGLLKPLSEVKADTNPDYVQYDFMEGIRELLLESVPSNYVFIVIDVVSNHVAKKLGFSLKEFGAILKNPRQAEEEEIAENMMAFARVTAQVLRGLGGVYVDVAESLENEITDEDVAVLRQRQLARDWQTETWIDKDKADISEAKDSQIGDRTYLELNDEAMQPLIHGIQKPSTILSQFQSFIQAKTEGFVGREYVFDAIQAFIQENKKGYFTIIGDPGQGKSAILAKYVQDTGCIAHFNFQLQGPNRADQFLESVCKQLVERYQLPYDPLPSNATQDGEFLGQLLDEVAQRRNGKPVVIAIDALDDVDSGSYRDANILYLPPHLPEGVYFVMTRRRDVDVPFITYAPVKIISLLDYQIDSQRDVRLYIQNRVDGSEDLRQKIDERQEKVSVFIDKIINKSENNFMYLRYVLLDIEKGFYKDLTLEKFPQGLEGYYNFHWQRMGMKANPLPDAKIKIIYILGEVKEPVSCQQICNFSGEDTPVVQSVLNEWKQVLHESLKDNQKYYRVYHQSFRDFLHHKDILETTGLTIPGIHRLISDKELLKWDNRRGNNENEVDRLSSEDEEYVLNLPYHLVNSNNQKDLVDLLTEYEFLQYKILSLRPQALIEDYELALHSDIQIHPQIKESLKLIQSAIDLAANVLACDPAQLAGQLWGRLQSFKRPEIQTILVQTQALEYPWLRPLASNLTPPGGPLLRTLSGHRDWVQAVAITPDGKIAVSGSDDCTLKVWDLHTGVKLSTLTGHDNRINGIAIAPDGKIAVSASGDCTLKVWDLHSKTELRTLVGHDSSVNAVAISSDGQLIVSASGDKTLKVWDLNSGDEVRTLIGHTGGVAAVAITPDGQLAISCAGDKSIRIWDLHSGNEVSILIGHNRAVRAIAITPDGKLAVSISDDDTLKIWDLSSATEIPIGLENTNRFYAIAITPNGRLAICGLNNSRIKVYDLHTGQEIRTFSGHTLTVNAVAITPDGKLMVSASSDNTIKIWNLDAEDVVPIGHKDWINAVAISSDGQLAVSASDDRTLKIWGLPTGSELLTLTGHKNPVKTVVITPDKQQVISASNKTIKIWNLQSGKELHTITGQDLGKIIAITADGQNVISECPDNSLRFWNLQSGTEIHILQGHSAVSAIAITPDERLAVSASRDKTLKVWDLNSGTELHTLSGHTNWVNAVAITPDGKLAVSTSSDLTLKVWDIDRGVELNTLIGHNYWVWAVAITPDGRFAVSGSWDQTLKVWNLESGQEIATFNSEGELNACAISSDGRTIVGGGRSDRIDFLRLEGM